MKRGEGWRGRDEGRREGQRMRGNGEGGVGEAWVGERWGREGRGKGNKRRVGDRERQGEIRAIRSKGGENDGEDMGRDKEGDYGGG